MQNTTNQAVCKTTLKLGTQYTIYWTIFLYEVNQNNKSATHGIA